MNTEDWLQWLKDANTESWPQWLKDADTENAVVEISPTGRVIWRDGVWRDGIWRDGVWRDGVWRDGIWRDGVWRDGVWHGGEWHDGVWRDGIWRDGIWRDGVWRDGVWHGGEWHGGDWLGGVDNPTRCMFKVCGSGDKIHVGCKSYTLSEAESLCDSGDLPEEAPARESNNGKLLRAAVLAQIAWQRALIG